MTSSTNSTNPTNPTERRLLAADRAALNQQVLPVTVENWVNRGWIPGYLDKRGTLYVDLNEIEAARLLHPRMKDGRKPRFSAAATIKPLPGPIRTIAEVADPPAEAVTPLSDEAQQSSAAEIASSLALVSDVEVER